MYRDEVDEKPKNQEVRPPVVTCMPRHYTPEEKARENAVMNRILSWLEQSQQGSRDYVFR